MLQHTSGARIFSPPSFLLPNDDDDVVQISTILTLALQACFAFFGYGVAFLIVHSFDRDIFLQHIRLIRDRQDRKAAPGS